MKNFLLSIIISLMTSISFAQVTPEAFIGLLPAIPSNACSMKKAERDNYLNYVDSLQQLLDNELERRNNEINANAQSFESQAKNNISKKYGLSQDEMEKLQNEDAITEEEKNVLINKALKNSTNLSLDEIKNLKNMSKEERKVWAEAYGKKKMTETQADPKKNQEKQLETKSIYELTTLQKHILDSIKAIETKFMDQFAQIDNDPQAKIILENIQKWNQEASNLMGETDKAGMQRMSELENKIKSEKEKYCRKYTSMYVDILRRYETYTKSSLPVWYQLESISTQQTKLQTGAEIKQEPGLLGIEKIANYLNLLHGVFKYNLFSE